MCAFQLRHAAERATSYAPTRRVSKIGIVNWVGVIDMFKDPIVGDQFLNRHAGQVVGSKVVVVGRQCKRNCRSSIEQTLG